MHIQVSAEKKREKQSEGQADGRGVCRKTHIVKQMNRNKHQEAQGPAKAKTYEIGVGRYLGVGRSEMSAPQRIPSLFGLGLGESVCSGPFAESWSPTPPIIT